MTQILPWHHRQWQRVDAMQVDSRLPHALLLRGPQGVGKDHFARRLAAQLLCEGPDPGQRPCADCRGCSLTAALTHPDYHELRPAEGKQQIGIDQVRRLIERVGLTTQYGGYKVALVSPAEGLTHAAANTLLKTLEEPPGDALFVLVSHRASALPATIRSRCQLVDFPAPAAADAKPWLSAELGAETAAELALRLAHGAPLAARDMSREGGEAAREAILEDLERLLGGSGDPIATAERWRDMGLSEALYWLLSMVCDLVGLKNGRLAHTLTHCDRADALQGVARQLDLGALFRLFDALIEARRVALGPQSLNEQLVLESIAIEWHRSGAARVKTA